MEVSKIIEYLTKAGHPIISSLIVWGVVSTLIYKASFAVSQKLMPGFPADFLKFMMRVRNLKFQDLSKFLVQQIDFLLAFRRTNWKLIPFVPSFFRSCVASFTTIFMGAIYLQVSGLNIFAETFAHISGDAYLRQISAGEFHNKKYILVEVNDKIPDFGLALVGSVSATCVFVLNFFADYVSIAQTRRFIYHASRNAYFMVPILLADLLVSLAILVVFVSVAVMISSGIIYLYFWLFSDLFESDGFDIGSFPLFLKEFCAPRLVIAASLLIDGALNLFGIKQLTPDVIDYLEDLYDTDLPFPTHTSIFSLLIISSLLTSIWIWLSCIGMLISMAVRAIPLASRKAILWTHAEEEPTRLLALFLILSWSMFWWI